MKNLPQKMVKPRVLELSPDWICTVDRNWNFKYVSDACKNIIGYGREELTNSNIFDFIHPKDHQNILKAGQALMESSKKTFMENRYIHKSGKEVPILWSVAWSDEDEVFFCIGRDATERNLVKQEIKAKDELHRTIVKNGWDLFALLDQDMSIIDSGSSSKGLGYTSELLIGINALSLVYPEDQERVKEAFSKVLASEEVIYFPEYRLKDAKGNWRWLQTTMSNHLKNPMVKAVVSNSREITEKVRIRQKLRENEQRFKSLFEHHIDMVVFQNREGIVIDVNPSTLSFFEVQKQEILNRPLSRFLPPEVASVCDQRLQKALEGKSLRFELTIPIINKGLFTFEIAKIPVIVDGEALGVFSIFRDITEISHSNTTIRQQAEKVNTILESITDAFFTIDRNWKFTTVNSEFEKLFRTTRKEIIGKSIRTFFLDEVEESSFQKLYETSETGKTVPFRSYIQKLDIWLEVKAYPSEEGMSVFIEDITERVKSRKELEKLSLVASKTTNGVVIMSAEGKAEWVNEGFTHLTGYSPREVIGRRPTYLLKKGVSDKILVQRIKEKQKLGKSFSEEMMIFHKSGKKLWLLIDVTPVMNEQGEISKFIAIQTDITERKETEEKQAQLTKDLFRQNRDLQQFTYIVSHNLRSPVASVMGLTEILNTTDRNSATFQTSLDYLKKSSEALDMVLKDLNLILSIRDKKGTTGNEKVQLSQVLDQVKTALKEPLESCGGEVFIKVGEDVFVKGNRSYLYSIFYNLLSNSIKYRSTDRSLEVFVQCFERKEKGVLVSFSDNGLGFDSNNSGDKVFKLYQRFHHHSEGRGIGLFLVKTHIDAMDGYIEVNSQVNEGTSFLIYLK